jgi:hypothetical protein
LIGVAVSGVAAFFGFFAALFLVAYVSNREKEGGWMALGSLGVLIACVAAV